jgi:hypothetical protein
MLSDERPSIILETLRSQIETILGPEPTAEDLWAMAFYLETLAQEYDERAGPEQDELTSMLRPLDAERLLRELASLQPLPRRAPLALTA